MKFPKKLPPDPVSLPLNQLPILGYLEQTVATVLMNSLRLFIDFKPKHPKLSASKSAVKYMALFIGGLLSCLLCAYGLANNPSNSEYTRDKYQKQLEKFKEECQISQKILESYRETGIPEFPSQLENDAQTFDKLSL